ncbi:MAG: hypothetical protein FWH42_02335 [Dehalococcoidia bacterium]|nr:hypothetical protein [Dehalococcoidia bacterium]
MNGGAVAAAAAAHAAMVQAVKASGVVIKVEPEEFAKIIAKNRDGLVVMSIGGRLKRGYNYITSYKGLAFYTKSPQEMVLPGSVDLVISKSIWMPE